MSKSTFWFSSWLNFFSYSRYFGTLDQTEFTHGSSFWGQHFWATLPSSSFALKYRWSFAPAASSSFNAQTTWLPLPTTASFAALMPFSGPFFTPLCASSPTSLAFAFPKPSVYPWTHLWSFVSFVSVPLKTFFLSELVEQALLLA